MGSDPRAETYGNVSSKTADRYVGALNSVCSIVRRVATISPVGNPDFQSPNCTLLRVLTGIKHLIYPWS